MLDSDTIFYRLSAPSAAQSKVKYPLVIFLHGAGARGKDNETPLKNLPKIFTDSIKRNEFPCFVLVPQCPKQDAWVEFPHFPESLQATEHPTATAKKVLHLIKYLYRQENIDTTRIYITGYSLGGEGTFDLISREPALFAAGIPICAVADTSKAIQFKNIPLWVFHGDADEVNNVAYSRMMVKAIQNLGGNPRYTEYKGVNHNSWDAAYSEPELMPWLFLQRRK